MSGARPIEKESLEAHVELCAERYDALEDKLTHVQERVDKIERGVVEIKDSLNNSIIGSGDRIIKIGTTIFAVLLTSVIGLVIHMLQMQ